MRRISKFLLHGRIIFFAYTTQTQVAASCFRCSCAMQIISRWTNSDKEEAWAFPVLHWPSFHAWLQISKLASTQIDVDVILILLMLIQDVGLACSRWHKKLYTISVSSLPLLLEISGLWLRQNWGKVVRVPALWVQRPHICHEAALAWASLVFTLSHWIDSTSEEKWSLSWGWRRWRGAWRIQPSLDETVACCWSGDKFTCSVFNFQPKQDFGLKHWTVSSTFSFCRFCASCVTLASWLPAGVRPWHLNFI